MKKMKRDMTLGGPGEWEYWRGRIYEDQGKNKMGGGVMERWMIMIRKKERQWGGGEKDDKAENVEGTK
jgi:hypothetical protein